MTKDVRFSIVGGLACMLLLLAFSPGCTKVPNGGIPIYLRLDSATLQADFHTYGTSASRIPDAWVESGSQNLGAYETPVTIPILAQGDVPVILTAGILDNGIVNTRAKYPFYRPDTFTIHNAVAGKIYTHHPTYQYYSNVHIPLNATFENAVPFNGMTVQNGIDADSATGGHCGAITMASADTVAISIQASGMPINSNGRQTYMEFQYRKANATDELLFDVGIEYSDATGVIDDYTLITIPPQDYWKKTYLNFSNIVGSYPGDTFKIFFVVYKNPGKGDILYIDNVKFLYFD